MPKGFKTHKFSLSLYKNSPERGFIFFADDRHKLSRGLGGQNFRYLEEIPEKIRKLLEKAKIKAEKKSGS
jgi:hypothetical protein